MGVNKVVYRGKVLIDLSGVTVTPNTLAEGVTAYDKSGNAIIGTAKIGTAENWVFTLEDDSTVTKAVFVE